MNLENNNSRRKMTEQEIEKFSKKDSKTYSRFKRNRNKKKFKRFLNSAKNLLKILSQIILWICA